MSHLTAPRSPIFRRIAALPFDLWVVLLYLAITLYLLARVLPQVASAIPGAGVANEDGWQNTWNMWWVRFALSNGRNPFQTDMLFYPVGASLYLQTLNITNALITLPVQWLGGPVAAYNIAVVLGFVFTGYGSYLLAWQVSGHRGGALAAGALVAFSPFHLSKLWDGHLSWVTMQWIPLFLVCLLRALDTGGWRWRFLAGAALAVATLTSWYYGIFSAIFVALLLAVRLPVALRTGRWRQELAALIAVGAVAALLLSPVLVPALGDYFGGSRIAPRYPDPPGYGTGWDGETSIYSADLFDMLFPSFLHPLWGDWSAGLHQAMRPGWFWTVAPGYAALALGAVGAWVFRRRAWPWATLVAALWVLMLGPRLRVAGENTGLPLPFDLLKYVPGMTLGHRPNHLAIFLLPLLGILVAYGIRALVEGKRAARVALALLVAVGVVELAFAPLPALPLDANPTIAALRGQPGAVLELPPDNRSSVAMIHQMAHERPIVGGYLARQPDHPPFVEAVPWVWSLWKLAPRTGPDVVAEHPGDGWQALSYYGIRTIVVRRNELSPEQNRRFGQVLAALGPGVSATMRGDLTICEVQPAPPHPFLFLGAGWLPPETQADRTWRWMGSSAAVTLVNPLPAPRWVTLSLRAYSYQQNRSLVLQLDGATLGSFAIPATDHRLELGLVLPPGQHTLTFTSDASPEQARPHRDLSLALTGIALTARP